MNQFLNWIFREKKLLNNFLNWIFLKKMILNNPLNWILPWNEWMNHILNRYLPFLMKSPLFCLFWTLFGQFSGTFPIRPVSKSPWLLNWIIFWIESAEFFLNWIIFWIESWVKRYWIEYWMNHFLAKFKHWIESDRVSNIPMSMWTKYQLHQCEIERENETILNWMDCRSARPAV